MRGTITQRQFNFKGKMQLTMQFSKVKCRKLKLRQVKCKNVGGLLRFGCLFKHYQNS